MSDRRPTQGWHPAQRRATAEDALLERVAATLDDEGVELILAGALLRDPPRGLAALKPCRPSDFLDSRLGAALAAARGLEASGLAVTAQGVADQVPEDHLEQLREAWGAYLPILDEAKLDALAAELRGRGAVRAAGGTP